MAGRARAWPALLLCVLGFLGLPSRAAAAEPRTVQAVLAGDPMVLERVESVLRPSLDHQGLVLVVTRASKVDPLDAVSVGRESSPNLPVAYLWLDLTSKPVNLILVETKSRLVYAQRLGVHPDPDEVETELIRFVIDQSLEAILSGTAAGVTPKQFRNSLAPSTTRAPPSTPASPPERPVANVARWGIAAGYSVDALGSDAVLHGPQVGVQLRLPHFQVQLRLAQRLPLELTRDQASIRLVSSAARLIASSPWTLGRELVVALGLGAGIDVTRVTPIVDGAVPAFWVSDPLLISQLAFEQAWGALSLSGYGGVEWDVLAARYVVRRNRGDETVWSPSRVRPCGGVSVGYLF